MSKTTPESPSAIIEKIDMRLALVEHTLSNTRPDKVTDELLIGLVTVIKDIQRDICPMVQFCEDMGDNYMMNGKEVA